MEWDKLVSQVSMKHIVNLSQIKQNTASMTTMLELQNCTEFSIYFVWPQIFAIHNNLLLHEASKQ